MRVESKEKARGMVGESQMQRLCFPAGPFTVHVRKNASPRCILSAMTT